MADVNPRRVLRNNSSDLPPFGWYWFNPTKPMPNCSWCLSGTVDRNGFAWCAKCDDPQGGTR